MTGSPSAPQLLAAVQAFLAGLPLTGRDAFHAKVAGNVLAIVAREIATASPNAAAADADLCVRIRSRALTPATPGLVDALIVATCARLRIDNPRYPTLARLEDSAPVDAAVRR